ncbi:MAG: transcription antitermination factor NusB [bacterium]
MTDRISPRRLSRELILQALYAAECGEVSAESNLINLVKEQPLSEKNVRFAREMLTLVNQHGDWADQQLAGLAEHWDVERMAAIDRAILRLALVELEHVPDTPMKVVLNEAIELARKFSTSKSPGFVNGILDAWVKRRGGGE